MKALKCVVLLGILALALPSAADAQAREGFWFNMGLGYGSLGCDGCDGREGGLSGGLALGGSVSQKLLIGAGTTGWTKSENDVRLSVGTFTALVRYYPSETSGLHFNGGLGIGSVQVSSGGVSATETGAAAVLGMGYDFRIGENMSITPFWNGAGVNAADVTWNNGQIGIGFTLH
ncbi:MAG TPA: outer membrane beta-barrel protein [Longimicrobiales bacterium]